MNAGQTVFSELMDHLPSYEFQKCVERYRGDAHHRGFPRRDQYLAMAFAQLTYRESLRDIEACLGSMCGKLYYMGFPGRVTRSTLGDANEAHDRRIFADFAQVLIATALPLCAEILSAWNSFRRYMRWIRQRSIFVCRYFRGPGSASTRAR